MSFKKIAAFVSPIVLVIIVDRLTKFVVRTSPRWQDFQIIPGWLAFHFTENAGMALGMRWAPTEVISIIAILATIGILIYVLYHMKAATLGYLVCMGLILGGAFGNIIDRLIMARIQGYGGILQGHVVDFIHFNLRIGGHPVFPYIFNVADVAISTAIIAMLIFHRRILPENYEERNAEPDRKSVLSTDGNEEKL